MNTPIRVLHLVAGLNRAGTETWLVSLLPHLLAEQVHCDFMVNEDTAYDYSEVIKNYGSNILVCNEYQNRLRFAWKFYSLLKRNGPYDVVHCHTHWFSGFEVFISAISGVKNRIVHAHNDNSPPTTPKRRLAILIMDILIRCFATGGLATSDKAGRSFLRRKWRSSPKWRIHLSTSDVRKFKPCEKDPSLRAGLGIPDEAMVVGHVGRFVPQKNHEFLLRSFSELLKLKPNSILVCVGDGPDKPAATAIARQLGIQDHLRLLSSTNEVHKYATGLFDVLVLPSISEGLGIVAVEAQAAGIPTILSDRFPPEACLIRELVSVLSLTEPASQWGHSMATVRPIASIESRLNWFHTVMNSEFEPRSNATALALYYRSLIGSQVELPVATIAQQGSQ